MMNFISGKFPDFTPAAQPDNNLFGVSEECDNGSATDEITHYHLKRLENK